MRQNCIIASQKFCRVAAFFARLCSIDHAAMQKIDGQKMKKPCKISILAPTVEKAHPTVEKAHPTVEKAHPTVEKAHPTVEKAQ